MLSTPSDDDRGFPWVSDTLCKHVKQHTYVIRDEYDAAQTTILSLAGWFDGTGYCPAYLPPWLGESLPILSVHDHWPEMKGARS